MSDIKSFRDSKVCSVWISFGWKPIFVRIIPKITAANAIAPFWAKVIKPYNDDSVLMPVFHSPYSIVSGSIDQNKTPVAPFAKPIKAKINKSSLSSDIG